MRLIAGKGSPERGACWMSALNYYAYNGATWTDQPPCVPPTIRALCIRLNDLCQDGEREALIGPHLFTPIGCDPSPEAEQKRAFLCADRAVRVWAPRVLEEQGLGKAAEKLRKLPAIVSQETARAASAAADAAAYASAADAAADAAAAATKQELLDLILECCAVGESVPMECATTKEATLALLER